MLPPSSWRPTAGSWTAAGSSGCSAGAAPAGPGRGRGLPQPRRRVRPRPGAGRAGPATQPPRSSSRWASWMRPTPGTPAWSPGACDWLQAHAPAEAGPTFVEPTIEGWPHAPWWVPEDGPPGLAGLHRPDRGHAARPRGLASVAGPGHGPALGADRPALRPGPYDMSGWSASSTTCPTRPGAEQALGQIGPLLGPGRARPGQPGETHSPLSFAPPPGSRARALFDDAVIEAHLDHPAAAQRDDGGWTFNFPAWSPAAELDWRGYVTVNALHPARQRPQLTGAARRSAARAARQPAGRVGAGAGHPGERASSRLGG